MPAERTDPGRGDPSDGAGPEMLKRSAVDVIVPVRDAYEEFAACLESVQRHGGYHRLILIDDGSSDERIGALFRRLAALGSSHLVLLRNEHKRGFAATVNRGMTCSRNDAVLLNPDTLVTRAWLDKLRRCAASDSRIGTITPFSNNAELCSFPLFHQHNPAPEDPERVNRAMELAAVPLYPDLPTAGGCCMFIRRRLIREIGVFDEGFGKSYETESDFSMRASAAGYRNVLCDDTFVVQLGSRSAVEQRSSLSEKSLAKVRARHPTYIDLVRDFISRDPVRPVRGMIQSQLAVLSSPAKPGVLHVLHDRGGGTEKYVHELIAASGTRYRHFFLRILPDRWRLTDTHGSTPTNYDHRWRLTEAGNAALTNYDYPRKPEAARCDWLAPLCSWLRIRLVHVHSLIGSGDDLLRILQEAAIPYCYSVHDMYLACPTVYLIGDRGEYCNATTDQAVCRRCLANLSGLLDVDIARWRDRYRVFLDGASRIFAPSKWAGHTLEKYYPGIKVTVAPPWPEIRDRESAHEVTQGFPLPADECRHVGVLGAIGPEKGARHLEGLVARVRDRRIPLRFVVVGYTDRDNRGQADDGVLTVHGPYRTDEVEVLFDYYGIGIVVFPTVWPETFGYTLSEAWMAGRPVLVPPGGALGERVLATGAGWTMDGWPDADSILDQLLELTAPGNRAELDRKANLARAAVRDERAGRDLIAKSYDDVLAERAPGNRHSVSRMRIHEAALRALGDGPGRQAADRSPAGQAGEPAKRWRLFHRFRG